MKGLMVPACAKVATLPWPPIESRIDRLAGGIELPAGLPIRGQAHDEPVGAAADIARDIDGLVAADGNGIGRIGI